MSKKPATPRKQKTRKLFVLDTNVLMHDPTSLFRFDEHDVYLPIATLEELDAHKRGLSDVSRNARQASRFLDEIVSGSADDIKKGLELRTKDGQQSGGRLYLQTEAINGSLPQGLATGKNDNQILAVVNFLQEREEQRGKQEKEPEREVVLVSKDINMRIKARALGLPAEDYFNDKVLEDADLLYTGVRHLPKDFWDSHGKDMESWKKEGHTYYRVRGPLVPKLHVNEFVYDESGERPLYALVKEAAGRMAVLETLRDYTHAKNSVWGITARNRLGREDAPGARAHRAARARARDRGRDARRRRALGGDPPARIPQLAPARRGQSPHHADARCRQHLVQPSQDRCRRRRDGGSDPARGGACGAHPHALGHGAAHRQHDGARGGRRERSTRPRTDSALMETAASNVAPFPASRMKPRAGLVLTGGGARSRRCATSSAGRRATRSRS